MRRTMIAAALLLGPALVHAQDAASRIDEFVNAQVKARRFMGSVLAARDGKIVLSKGYGSASIELDVPNKPETKFRLGSITKQFVAAAILQLEEKGKLSLQDPLCKYVPECPAAWQKVTIHHLLSHTSGIPNFTSFPDYPKTWMLPSRPEETMKRFRDKPLDFQPGERWNYSNSAYVVLGYLVEKISGSRYEDYLRKNVFDAAGMSDSGHDTFEEIIPNRATGYSRDRGKWINSHYHDMSIPIGGGDLYSTVLDMYKWERALAAGKIVSKASMDKMYTPVQNRYGYGWSIDRQYGRLRYSHGGGINGFSTFFARFPEQNAAVVVLANMDFANVGEVTNGVIRILFGEESVRPGDRKAITLDAATLPEYAGLYELYSGVNATVSAGGGNLYAALPGGLREQIFAEAPDRFFSKTADRQFRFERGGGGKVVRAVMVRDGVETGMKRISETVPARAEITLDAAVLAQYAGEYEIRPGFSITVTVDGGKLYGQATGQPRFELAAEAKDKFFLKVVDAQIEFQRSANGAVSGGVLRQGGQNIALTRVR